MRVLQSIVVLASICVHLASGAVIVPGATWLDTSGAVIQAHGGGFLKVSGNRLFYFS